MRKPALVDVEQMYAFEEAWDTRLGGQQTRPYRELLGYCIARIVSAGGTVEDVLTYVEQMFERFTVEDGGAGARA